MDLVDLAPRLSDECRALCSAEMLCGRHRNSWARGSEPNAVAREYLIHDRDSIFARHLDDSIRALGLAVLRSLFASPKANAICERVIGTIRRECLDWMTPMSEGHLRSILREWVAHYNGGRPHSALGRGVPGPSAGSAPAANTESHIPHIDFVNRPEFAPVGGRRSQGLPR